MAVSSNINKYTIDGVEIPVYPNSVVASDNLVSKSWNDMYGVFKDIPVNLKAKVNWVFDFINKDQLKLLYGQMIRDKITQTGSRFFDINTDFPGVGFISGKFYIGAPTSFTSKGAGYGDGTVPYWQCEIHWIEVDGIKLNSPLTNFTDNIILDGRETSIKELLEGD